MGTSTAQICAGFLKVPIMTGVGMPHFYRRGMATGELVHVTVTLGDADFRKSPMKMIYRKLPKTASPSVTCHPLCTYEISWSE